MTDEKFAGPLKNMGGPVKLIHVIMFKILKSCQKYNLDQYSMKSFPSVC